MALFPQGKTHIREQANAGEKRVLDALARQLEDDYTVWHNIPILGSGREPDFVILHPQHGLLILEVRDWRRRAIADANPMQVTLLTDREPASATHPVSQARAYMLDVAHLLEKHPELRQPGGERRGKLVVPWGWGAVLSHVKRAEVATDPAFNAVFEPHQVLLADDLADDIAPMAFQQRLLGMFHAHWHAALTLPQLALVRGLLFPELRLGVQQMLPLEPPLAALVVRDPLHVLDPQQEALARGEGHRVIHGPAGSGKTMILVFRALQLQHAAHPERPVLVLCHNRALRDHIDAMLRARGAGPTVQVHTFHGWALELVKRHQLAPVKDTLTQEDLDALAAVACEAIDAGRVPLGQYSAVLIDEAHELPEPWIAAAAKMADAATASVLVLYDDALSTHPPPHGAADTLRTNYRNTREVLALALECAWPVLQGKPASAGRSGPLPRLRQFAKPAQEFKYVIKRIAQLRAAGRSLNDIVVLMRQGAPLRTLRAMLAEHGIPAMFSKDASRAKEPQEVVRLTTLTTSKGLEYPVVFLVGLNLLDASEGTLADEVRLLYVGITRATEELYLSAFGGSAIVDRVEAALGRLQQQPLAA